MGEEEKTHSKEYLGDAREYWWNEDYLELLAKRLNLNDCSTLVDVGCGHGHISYNFAPFLKNNASIYGIDFEEKWINVANEKQKCFNNTKNVNFNFICGDANNINLEDEISDITICQTLLIHVKDPLKVIKEMMRITKKGGLVVAIEPNNIINSMVSDASWVDNIKESLADLEIEMRIQKGKEALGEGFDSIGDVVPNLFLEAGLKNTKVWVSDKALSIIPPYDTDEKKARVGELYDWIENKENSFDYNKQLRYYLAGGGNKDTFEVYWTRINKGKIYFKKYLDNQKYIFGGGSLMYIVAGYK